MNHDAKASATRFWVRLLFIVRRQCGEPPIFNRAANREMVETLPLTCSDPEVRMDRIVDVT